MRNFKLERSNVILDSKSIKLVGLNAVQNFKLVHKGLVKCRTNQGCDDHHYIYLAYLAQFVRQSIRRTSAELELEPSGKLDSDFKFHEHQHCKQTGIYVVYISSVEMG